jgi:Family of unknown function (DUF6527)
MTDKFELRKVQYMPTELEPGILYVAEEFKAAAHLCACGCGSVVRTPLNRWALVETEHGPSLHPSVGNWQEPCQSHYWIDGGKVRWAPKWSRSEIEVGRREEQERLEARYQKHTKLRQWWNRLKSFLSQTTLPFRRK